ncbi:MAG TPA: hypothetical protein VGD62_12425, partial [Acidobacteriaceae bacterium]
MLQVVNTLIERLLGWPIAALILGVVFRKSIARLIDRIEKGKIAGFEVSTRSALDQLVGASAKSATDDQLSSLTQPPSQPPPGGPPPDAPALDERRKAAENYGGDQPIIQLAMTDIENSLASLGLPRAGLETNRLVIRHLAVTQILYSFERLYRLIFGSQITAMRLLNLSGPHPSKVLRPIYDKAVTQSPEYFSTYTFEAWLGFLLQSVAITRMDEDLYLITHLGRGFLEW